MKAACWKTRQTPPKKPCGSGSSRPESAPDKPTTVEIGFEEGIPVSVNGKKLAPLASDRRTQRNRRGQRRRPHGAGRKSAGRNQIARAPTKLPGEPCSSRRIASSSRLPSTARPRTTSRSSRCAMRRWFITACGSRRCVKRSTDFSPARRSASPARWASRFAVAM